MPRENGSGLNEVVMPLTTSRLGNQLPPPTTTQKVAFKVR